MRAKTARSRCRWSVSGGLACGTLRECHRFVDGASERLVGTRDCSAVRVSAAAAAQMVLQPVVWPPTGGHAQLVAGPIETGQAAGEGVLGLARANRPRQHVATRRGAPAKRVASMDVYWTCCHDETIADWPCCGHVRGTDTAARCKGTDIGSIVAGRPSYGSGWRIEVTVGPYWLLAPNGQSADGNQFNAEGRLASQLHIYGTTCSLCIG